MTYHIRPLTTAEATTVITEWTAREGWHPSQQDANLFYPPAPHDFFGGFLAEKLIAAISAVNYGQVGYIGLYIVDPLYRGKGYGLQIFKAALDHLSACETIGLDGVIAQQSNYQKMGFRACYQQDCLSGTLTAEMDPNVSAKFDVTDIIAKYNLAFPVARNNLFTHWVKTLPTLVLYENNKIVGAGSLRKVNEYIGKLGPIIADSPVIAQKLIASLMHYTQTKHVIVIPPAKNSAAIKLYQQLNFELRFSMHRMYRGVEPIQHDLTKIYGIATAELG